LNRIKERLGYKEEVVEVCQRKIDRVFKVMKKSSP
jgi:hypothetical protein